MDATIRSIVESTFPASLRPDLQPVLAIVPTGFGFERAEGPTVSVNGEAVEVLARLYSPEPATGAIRTLTNRQRLIMDCLYSRHYDGHVRQRHLERLQGDEPWLPLFVLRLVSEYVIEIAQTALDNIGAIPRECYQAFASENRAFLALTRQRIVSYYSCYYRSIKFEDFPGYLFLRRLDLWHGSDARRLLRLEVDRQASSGS